MAKIVIFGTGDIARLAHFYFTRDSGDQVVGFTVDAAYCTSSENLGLPLVPFEKVVGSFPPSEHQMFVAVSYARMNRLRAEKYAEAKGLGYQLASYVSSRCSYLSQFQAGDNCFILEDNTIQPYVRIGCNVTLWSGNHIGHDSVIEDHCFISSHVVVSGHCRIGAYTFIGVNATLRNSINIAPHSLIGAGALIMSSTQEKGVYVAQRTSRFSQDSDAIKL